MHHIAKKLESLIHLEMFPNSAKIFSFDAHMNSSIAIKNSPDQIIGHEFVPKMFLFFPSFSYSICIGIPFPPAVNAIFIWLNSSLTMREVAYTRHDMR